MNASFIISIMILGIFLVGCTLVSHPEVPENVVVAENTPPAAPEAPAAPETPSAPEAPVEVPIAPTPSPVTGAVVITNTSTTHTVNMVDGGFEDASITIKVGDTVVWQNVREDALNRAMVIGTRDCQNVKSRFFLPGSQYSYKFTKPMTCSLVDGIFTTQMMKVIVR